MTETSLVPVERVEQTILILRGQKVILDSDLAALYGVPVKRLNEQVKRNAGRFPPDFAFQLARGEFANLKSQFATSSLQWGGKRKLPTAFTEHGALMVASVLNSPRAVEMSILVVRAFVRFRRILATNRQLAAQVDELERKIDQKFAAHDKSIEAHRKGIVSLYSAIENLMPTLNTVRSALWARARARSRTSPRARLRFVHRAACPHPDGFRLAAGKWQAPGRSDIRPDWWGDPDEMGHREKQACFFHVQAQAAEKAAG